MISATLKIRLRVFELCMTSPSMASSTSMSPKSVPSVLAIDGPSGQKVSKLLP